MIGVMVALVLGLWGLQFALRAAPATPPHTPLLPDALGVFESDAPVLSAHDWVERRAPILRAAFQRLVYGELPPATPPVIAARRVIDAQAFDGAARIEEWLLDVPLRVEHVRFHAIVITPNGARTPPPVVIATNFCGNRAALAGRYKTIDRPAWTPARCRTPLQQWTTETLHGADIIAPPFDTLTRAGYAVVTFFPGEIVEDDFKRSHAALAAFAADLEGRDTRTGALAAWAWGYSRAIDAVSADPSFDAKRIALWGHSRFGKAALLAAAFDPRASAVIANQSGTFGAALSRKSRGESLRAVTSSFPYWFTPSVQQYAQRPEDLPLDQHLLIALIAPRPILLGGARLDRWSDPAGAFAAAEAAGPVYRLFGREGIEQATFSKVNLNAGIAAYMRPGGHGVRPRDWRETIAFLDAHLKRKAPEVSAAPR